MIFLLTTHKDSSNVIAVIGYKIVNDKIEYYTKKWEKINLPIIFKKEFDWDSMVE